MSAKPPSNDQAAVICVCTRVDFLVDTEHSIQRLQKARQHVLIHGEQSSLLQYLQNGMRAESKATD